MMVFFLPTNFFFYKEEFFISDIGMYVSDFGMYIPNFGMYVSNFGMKNPPRERKIYLWGKKDFKEKGIKKRMKKMKREKPNKFGISFN